MKVELHKLESSDVLKFIELIKLFEVVFNVSNTRMPDPGHLKKLLINPYFFVLVAEIDGHVVGGLTVYVLDQYHSDKSLAYIYDLAVAEEFQRKGIGTKLISQVNEYCRNRGIEEVFLQAEQDEDHAVRFYRSTNPTEEEAAVHFSYKLT